MSEKMDGIRAYWDGKRLLSRHGNQLFVPLGFTKDFPSIPLDGELWMGRGTFENLCSLMRSKNGDWSRLRYHIFDSPSFGGSLDERIQMMKQIKLPKEIQ